MLLIFRIKIYSQLLNLSHSTTVSNSQYLFLTTSRSHEVIMDQHDNDPYDEVLAKDPVLEKAIRLKGDRIAPRYPAEE